MHVDVFGDFHLRCGGDISHVAHHQLIVAVGNIGDRGLAVHVGHGIGAERLELHGAHDDRLLIRVVCHAHRQFVALRRSGKCRERKRQQGDEQK